LRCGHPNLQIIASLDMQTHRKWTSYHTLSIYHTDMQRVHSNFVGTVDWVMSTVPQSCPHQRNPCHSLCVRQMFPNRRELNWTSTMVRPLGSFIRHVLAIPKSLYSAPHFACHTKQTQAAQVRSYATRFASSRLLAYCVSQTGPGSLRACS